MLWAELHRILLGLHTIITCLLNKQGCVPQRVEPMASKESASLQQAAVTSQHAGSRSARILHCLSWSVTVQLVPAWCMRSLVIDEEQVACFACWVLIDNAHNTHTAGSQVGNG